MSHRKRKQIQLYKMVEGFVLHFFLLLVGCSSPYVSKSLGTAATSGLLYKPLMIDEDDFWSNWWNED
jgi:hypothetical protein